MTVVVSEFIDVQEKAKKLGCETLDGVVLLPSNFEDARAGDSLTQVSEAATVRVLGRQVGINVYDIVREKPDRVYIQNNAIEWVAPVILFSATVLNEHPDSASLLLDALQAYLREFLKGIGGDNTVKLDVVVEREGNREYRKVSYRGGVEGLSAIAAIVKEVRK